MLFYGLKLERHKYKDTWIDPEEYCTDYGQFRRKALVYHRDTKALVECRAAIPDTYFSIPATTDNQHGYITGRDDGNLEFRPHDDQSEETPAQYRRSYKKACR